MDEIVITLLSAGVFTSLVTGIFSLIITVKNNKTLKYLEQEKEANQKQGQLYKTIFSAREELLSTLPPETQVRAYPVLETFSQGNSEKLQELISSCVHSQRTIWIHFNKYCPYFSDDECKTFNKLNDEFIELCEKNKDFEYKYSVINSEDSNNSANGETNPLNELSSQYRALLLDIVVAIINLEQWYFSLLEKYIRSYMK